MLDAANSESVSLLVLSRTHCFLGVLHRYMDSRSKDSRVIRSSCVVGHGEDLI